MNTFKLKIILSVLIIVFILNLFFVYKIKIDNSAKRFYKQGLEFYSKKDYSNAYYNFKKIKPLSDLYELSLLKEYQCANFLDDKKTSRNILLSLINITNDEYIRPYVLYKEAVLSSELNLNDDKKSLKKFNIIYDKYKENDFSYASAYKIAKLTNNNTEKKEKFIEYLKYSPQGRFSLDSLSELEKMNIFLSDEEREIIADGYFSNNDYSKALKYYKNSDFYSVWYKISKCYRAQKKFKEEKDVILKGFSLDKSSVSQKDINSAIDRIIKLEGKSKIQTLQNLYTNYQGSIAWVAIVFNLAEASQKVRAYKLYEHIAKNYPQSSWASNSLWEMFWDNYKLKRYKTCIKIAKIYNKNYSDTKDAPRVLYWLGKTYLKEKNSQKAKEVFINVIEKYPISYYAFLSQRQLKIKKENNIISKKAIKSYDISSLNKNLFKDSKILAQLAAYQDFETIEELKINDEYVKSLILNKKENYPLSINTAKNAYLKEIFENKERTFDFSDFELKLIFPILYEDEINKYSLEFNQSPYLFLSLIREESHFDKNAKSSAGAFGLVQLMSTTADFIEKTTVSKEIIQKDNIRIGLKYFNYLVDFFKGNYYYAILAYNAGPGNVQKWINDKYIYSEEIDEFIENIPYLETKNYIKKILCSYWIYYNVYN